MRFLHALLLAALAALITSCAPAPAAAQPTAQPQLCFPDVPDVADCVDPALAAFWRANGGLPIFGYPIGPSAAATPEGAAAPITSQPFERNRLELHPANPAPYRVQLGRLGAERLSQLGRDHWADGGEPGPEPGCLWFPETRHNVCDQADGAGFKRFWEGNGLRVAGLSPREQSLALFGLPLTTANPEPGPDGELIVTQWFERARFEWHPDNPEPHRVLLGLLGREAGPAEGVAEGPPGPSIYGVEINRGSVGASIGALPDLGRPPVRYNGVLWAEVEPRRGDRIWEAMARIEAELAAISATGGTPMVVVRGAPAWAQAVRGSSCGPIRAEALPDYAAFLGELVARLSQPPYNVRYWELGNEPDADRHLVGGDSPYGCWGDSRQPDFGAGQYAAMLAAAYPAIKTADPGATVILGGLLLECDPTLAGQDRPCLSGSFFENLLKAGGGASFDMVGYHSYVYWVPGTIDWDLSNVRWAHRGGALLGKLHFLKEVMARYGVSKPVIMNEGGLLCYRSDPSCGPQGFYEAQANHAVRMYARAQTAGLAGALWYTLNGPGWQEGGLLDSAQQPRPAYQTLSFMAPLFGDAKPAGSSADGALERHAFRTGDAVYEVLWTNDGSTREVPAPPGARALYSHLGERSDPGPTIAVGFQPVIVEATP
ncbi:MAG TPA: hypothetical protein PKD53_22625 [Chloroflexaceae bacterium]|mgnify:CR=1 FL=1|nr:hypothetical protein [Chloroflexaceae bacterium]